MPKSIYSDLENINPSNVEESNHYSYFESQETNFRTIQLSSSILDKYPSKNYGKNGQCKIKLVPGNPKSITSMSKFQEILLRKSANCYA
jgi:hypothetical protein